MIGGSGTARGTGDERDEGERVDILAELQELALASRLKRLSEALMAEADLLYQDLGVDFRPRWFPVFYTLSRHSPMTITQLAQALGLTHPAVSQVASQLYAAGLIQDRRDQDDDRRRLLSLSPAGRRTLLRLEPVWIEIRAAAREVLSDADADLLREVERLETVIARRSVVDRVRERLGLPAREAVQIVGYRPAYKKHFRALNEDWLRGRFSVEEHDARMLNDPNGTIIRKGGEVLFALIGSQVVGTGALVQHTGGLLELCKMAVVPAMRGRGIGRRLAEAIIARAQATGSTWLYLQTSPRLEEALRLYRRLGFRRVRKNPLPRPEYDRCSVTMRLKLA